MMPGLRAVGATRRAGGWSSLDRPPPGSVDFPGSGCEHDSTLDADHSSGLQPGKFIILLLDHLGSCCQKRHASRAPSVRRELTPSHLTHAVASPSVHLYGWIARWAGRPALRPSLEGDRCSPRRGCAGACLRTACRLTRLTSSWRETNHLARLYPPGACSACIYARHLRSKSLALAHAENFPLRMMGNTVIGGIAMAAAAPGDGSAGLRSDRRPFASSLGSITAHGSWARSALFHDRLDRSGRCQWYGCSRLAGSKNGNGSAFARGIFYCAHRLHPTCCSAGNDHTLNGVRDVHQ